MSYYFSSNPNDWPAEDDAREVDRLRAQYAAEREANEHLKDELERLGARLDAVLALAEECEDSPSFAERGIGRLVRAAATGEDRGV